MGCQVVESGTKGECDVPDTTENGNENVGASSVHADTSFFGSYIHALDTKGRIIIPNAYRKPLGETFTIGPTRDFTGIALYPTPVFEAIIRDLESLNQRKPVVQKVKAQFFKLSYPDVQADGQGRLLLPTTLRMRMLQDAKEVEISGDSDCVRIINSERASGDDEYFMQNLDELMDEMGKLDE